MSPKDNSNILKIRNVIIMLLLVNASLLTLGILTRSPSTITDSENFSRGIITIFTDFSDQSVNYSEIDSKLNKIQDSLDEIEASLKGIKETEPKISGALLYETYVDEIIDQYYPDLSAEFIKAMIYHESRYQPDALNLNTGVQGLMQINPKWHTERAYNLGVENLFDPYGNILVGCDILNEVMQTHSFEYAVNVFAGGYSYANSYENSTSPYIKAVNSILHQMQSGEIILGGE